MTKFPKIRGAVSPEDNSRYGTLSPDSRRTNNMGASTNPPQLFRERSVSIIHTQHDSTKKQKQRHIRRVGRKHTEDLGANMDLLPTVTKINPPNNLDALEGEESYEQSSPTDMSEWDMTDASAALDRLQMTDQQRKQLEIATNLEMIHKRIRQALEDCGIDPDLDIATLDVNRPPVYIPDEAENPEKDRFKIEVNKLVALLHDQENDKNSIIRDVDDFLGMASLDDSLSEAPLHKALEGVKVEETEAETGAMEIGEAFRYTEELADKMKMVGIRLMREAGIISSSSDEDEDEDEDDDDYFGKKGRSGKAARELLMFSNPAAFSNNTNVFSKSLEQTVQLVRGRSHKDQIKQLVKQYKVQIKVTEQWLDDLKKREEENRSLNQQVKQLKNSRDQANKLKEEFDLKKRFFERKANELDQQNQRFKATNESLGAKNRKLESDLSRLQDKLDTMEDEAIVAKEFGARKAGEGPGRATAMARAGGTDEATKQYIQSLKSDVANFQEVIKANTAKIAALEKELITEKGNVSRLKHELGLASRATAVPPSAKEKEQHKDSVPEPPTTVDTNKINDSQIDQITNNYEKAKLEIKELKLELSRKTVEVENLEKQTKQMRQEMMSIFDDGDDPEETPTPPPSLEGPIVPEDAQQQEGDIQESNVASTPVPGSTVRETPQQKMVPASQVQNMRRVMRAMTVDHQGEIKKLTSYLDNEKSRTEANTRRLEQTHKEQLVSVHRQAVQLLRMINRFKSAVAGILEKEMVLKVADSVRNIRDLNTDETVSDTREMLNVMASQASSVFVSIENNIQQAFLNIRLEIKDKLAANQITQQNLKTAAMQTNKGQKGVEYMIEQLKDAREQLQAVKESFLVHKKQEESRYQSLYQRYMRLRNKYCTAQKDMDQFQKDFVEALCLKETELDDTRIAHSEAQRLYEEQKKLATQLHHKINSKLEYWDEHVSLCAHNMRESMKILHKAVKENKISLMVHNLTVGMIKLMMDIPVLRLRSIFKRYIRMRRFQSAKEEMERELKGLEDDEEHKDMVDDYKRYLSRMDTRLDRRTKLWQGEIDKLEEIRRLGWKEFTDVWEGHFKGTDFMSLTEEDLFVFSMGMERGDLYTPSPVPPIRKRKKGQRSEQKYRPELRGVRLPRLENNAELIGQRVSLLGGRPDMWKVRSSRVERRDGEMDDEFTEAITVPKVAELENNKHMRSAYKSLRRQKATKRSLLPLQPAELYDFQEQVPRPISKAFHDSAFRLDPNADMFSLSDDTSTPNNTEFSAQSVADAETPRTEVKIPKFNVGTQLY